MAFDPGPNERFRLQLDSTTRDFLFAAHPAASTFVHAMEGGKATVYRLVSESERNPGGELRQYALKVMRHAYSVPELARITENLDRLKELPGMRVCERRCLTPKDAAATLRQYPELTFAIVMPWVDGKSWYECLMGSKDRTFALTREESLTLARNFCAVLLELEQRGSAHCDLSAGNLMLDRGTLNVDLIDVEDMFAPGFTRPSGVPAGTPGYQHRTSGTGQWGPAADRFSAAVLLSEMLALYDPEVVQAAYSESFFDPGEMQVSSSRRYPILQRAISLHSGRLAGLLDRTWASDTLEQCPRIQEWHQALNSGHVVFVPLEAPAQTVPARPFWSPLKIEEQPPTVRFSEAIKPEQAARPTVRWES